MLGGGGYYFVDEMIIKIPSVKHYINKAFLVYAPPSSPSGNLEVFLGIQKTKINTVKFAQRLEANCLSRHIYSHSESLGRIKNFDQACSKKLLNELFNQRN